MARIVTHAEVAQVPDGGELFIEPGAELTPLAKSARRREKFQVSVGSPSVGSDTLRLRRASQNRILVRLGKTDESVVEKVASEVMAALGSTTVTETAPGLPPSAPTTALDVSGVGAQPRARLVVITATGRNQRRGRQADRDLGGAGR